MRAHLSRKSDGDLIQLKEKSLHPRRVEERVKAENGLYARITQMKVFPYRTGDNWILTLSALQREIISTRPTSHLRPLLMTSEQRF